MCLRIYLATLWQFTGISGFLAPLRSRLSSCLVAFSPLLLCMLLLCHLPVESSKQIFFSHVELVSFVADAFCIVFSSPLVLLNISGYPLLCVYLPANIPEIHCFLAQVRSKILSTPNSTIYLLNTRRRPYATPLPNTSWFLTVFNQVLFSTKSPWVLPYSELMLVILNMSCLKASSHVREPLSLLEKSLAIFCSLIKKHCVSWLLYFLFFPRSEPLLVRIKFSYIC